MERCGIKGQKPHVMEMYLILGAFMFSGAAALIYEVLWTRALSLVLGSTVYALSTMLSTFMAGLAIGAYLSGKFADRFRNLLFAFGLCELGIGISGLLSIPVLFYLPSFYLTIYRAFHSYPMVFFSFQILICVLVMIIPTILMGATFPIVCARITQSIEEVGKKTGKAYSINTIGAVLGSFAAGFILIPAIGIKGTAIVAACVNTAIALIMISLSGKRIVQLVIIILPVIGLSAGWLLSSENATSLINFYTARNAPLDMGYESIVRTESSLITEIFHEERPEGEVRAFRGNQRGELLLQVSGKIEGTGFGDLPNTLLLAYLPIAAHPTAGSFLNIGLGTGVTLEAAKSSIKDVELIEINPSVIKAVRMHGPAGLLDNVRIVEHDARNYLMRTERKYDIISSEPSIPTEPAVANLFTKEFFELSSEKLNPNGIFCQWLPYYMLDNDDIHMMIKTFSLVFPYTYVWEVNLSKEIIMIGSREPFILDLNKFSERMKNLNRTGFKLDYTLLMTPEKVSDIVRKEDVPVNTDDHPILEFTAVKRMLTYSGKIEAEKKRPPGT